MRLTSNVIAALFALLIHSGTLLVAQQPETEATVASAEGVSQVWTSFAGDLLLLPADYTALSGSGMSLSREHLEAVEDRSWGRYALVGAGVGGVLGASYFHFAVAPTYENDASRGYGPSLGLGYVIYAIPGALLGGFVGAILADR